MKFVIFQLKNFVKIEQGKNKRSTTEEIDILSNFGANGKLWIFGSPRITQNKDLSKMYLATLVTPINCFIPAICWCVDGPS